MPSTYFFHQKWGLGFSWGRIRISISDEERGLHMEVSDIFRLPRKKISCFPTSRE
jgi:hypothetical protein